MNAIARIGAAADGTVGVAVARGIGAVVKGASGAAKGAMSRDIQAATAADVGSRSEVHGRAVAVRVIGDSYAIAIGAGLKIDGVSPAYGDITKKGIGAGAEVRGAARSIRSNLDARGYDRPSPDVFEVPAPLIGRSSPIECQRRIAPVSTRKLLRLSIDKSRSSTAESATTAIHALILTWAEVAGHVLAGSLARSAAAYVIPAVPTREAYCNRRIAVGVIIVRRLDALTAVAAPTRVDLI